jgi:hypothetical protein
MPREACDKKIDRQQSKAPHINIGTEAHQSKSGHNGWLYGWKLHLACIVACVWMPFGKGIKPLLRAV